MKKRLIFGWLLCLAPVWAGAQVADATAAAQVVDSLIQVSRKLSGQGDFDKALEVNAAAEKLALEKLGRESVAYASCCHNRARVANFKRDLSEVEKWYVEALSIREKVLGKAHPDYSASLTNLGILYKDLGDYEKSERLQLEANAIMEKAVGKNHPDYAPCLFNLANLYEIMGDYEKAESLYLEAKFLVERTLGKDHPGYIKCLNNLGNLYMDLGSNGKAEQLYSESNAIREKKFGKNHPLYATGLFNLAILYMAIGQYEKAEPLYLEAKAIREAALGKNNPDYVLLLHDLAILYLDMGNYEKAEPLCREVMGLGEKVFGGKHSEYAKFIGNLAFLHWRKGEFEKAEPLYLEAMSIEEKALGKEHPNYLSDQVNLIVLYEAQSKYTESESLMKDFLGSTQSRFLQSTAFLSEREIANYGASFRFSSNHLLGYLLARLKKGDPIDTLSSLACDWVIFQKGFLLTAASRLTALASSSIESKEISSRLQVCRRGLAAEYAKPIAERDPPRVADLEENANALEKDLARTVAGYGEAMRQVKWQEVQAALKPGEAAVEFIHYRYYTPKATDSTMYAALVLRPGDAQPQFIPLFEEKELTPLLRGAAGGSNFLKINALYALKAIGSKEKSLYELIWQPLESLLAASKTIYCSPSGLLHRINLAAIPASDGKAFGDRRQLVLLGSTRQLVVPSAVTPSGNSAYLAGGIRYATDSTAIAYASRSASRSRSTEQSSTPLPFQPDSLSATRGGVLDYLPATAAEVHDIGRTLAATGFRAKVDTGFYATEEAFRQLGDDAPSPRIVHLATHGYFFPDPVSKGQKANSHFGQEPVFKMSDHPMIRSGLILAGAKQAWLTGKHPQGQEDGILTAYEISQMNLSGTELVVLSACETGLGDILGNEGVYGLQRAFKIAGAKYLIMSLWKVDDRSTREFMTNFYRHWLTENQAVPQAFRATQREIRAKFAGAYEWAGFVLIE